MRIEIKHEIHYSYTEPVFLEPQVLRLRPRSDTSQRLISFELNLQPQPDGLSEITDLNDNSAAQAWFSGLTGVLEIGATSVVETSRANPFDFFLDPAATALPPSYGDELKPDLAPFFPASIAPEVVDFAETTAQRAAGETLPFLSALTRRIHEDHTTIIRLEGEPLPAAETLSAGAGACRDLTVLFIESARAVGLAARFVSGYLATQPEREEHELHAWAEVYLPGAGWRGYDPTSGLAVAERHVHVAAAANSSGAAPTSGHFRSSSASSQMRTDLHVKILG